MEYTNHQESLIAVASHLALTKHKSRTPPFIAKKIGLPVSEVKEILEHFRGIFRKSTNKSEKGEYFYTLQIRYAMRGSQYDDKTEEEEGTPLEIEHVVSLLEFITNQAHQEQDQHIAKNLLEQTRDLTLRELKQSKNHMAQELTIAKNIVESGRRASQRSFGASILAAIAAIIAALIAAWGKSKGI